MSLKKYIIVFLWSMVPIVELRGAIPIASLYNIPLYHALPIAVLGNIIPVPFIILFFKFFFTKFRNWPIIGKIFVKVHNKAVKEADKIKNYAAWGLFIFVAIPLPGTGAWTGSVIASIIEMDSRKSFLCIAGGVISSGIIMSIISYFLPEVFKALI